DPGRRGPSARNHPGGARRAARPCEAAGGMNVDEADARRFCVERTDADGIARLERLAALLAEENTRQNLVSDSSLQAIWRRHFADSLQLIDHVPAGAAPWLDLGSGAGFPGLALAAVRPRTVMVL